MAKIRISRRSFLAVPPAAVLLASGRVRAASEGTPVSYFPPAGKWERKAPEAVGMDSAKLKEAIEFAKTQDSGFDFARDQVKRFGPPMGLVPKSRASVNGIIIRHGYIVGEFGDINAVDPVYSMAKSINSLSLGVAVTQGKIKNLDEPVKNLVKDGGYDSPHNSKITWRHHVTQTSEWEGELFDRNANFLGVEKFGGGAMQPRAIKEPGAYYEYNDVRMNRFALSMARVFGKSLPEVLKENVMDPIGASNTWKWLGYDNSYVDINGKKVQSVTGGSRWGGGFFTNDEDIGRMGLLLLNKGRWNGKQIISEAYLRDAVQATPLGPDYGYLFWLNTKGKKWPTSPKTAYAAVGNGSNMIWVDPEHDLVMILRWIKNDAAVDGVAQRVIASIKG